MVFIVVSNNYYPPWHAVYYDIRYIYYGKKFCMVSNAIYYGIVSIVVSNTLSIMVWYLLWYLLWYQLDELVWHENILSIYGMVSIMISNNYITYYGMVGILINKPF